jgi:DNA-binding CsgD family transcriptional regulator/PAS domain-containing protein
MRNRTRLRDEYLSRLDLGETITSPKGPQIEMTIKSREDQMATSIILSDLHPQYDTIVASIYRAGSGLDPWLKPIGAIAKVFQSWVVQFICVNKKTGVIQWAYEDGSAQAAAGVDFITRYHRIDPRLKDLMRLPVNGWYSCEDHFDEAAVAADRYYTEYLIPYGGRYCYAGKIFEDDSAVALIGAITRVGQPPMSAEEKAAFTRLSEHFAIAFDIRHAVDANVDRTSVGAALLEKMRQPMMLIDNERRLAYRNRSASALLKRADAVFDLDGSLVCHDADSDLALTLALRDLELAPMTVREADYVASERKSLRLTRRDGRRIAATVMALRPESTMGAFGHTPHALLTIFEPGASIEVDPFILATTFDLTPAEARVASLVANGRSPEQCADEIGVKVSTIRTQLVSVFAKTGATGQADLVRMVLSATAL